MEKVRRFFRNLSEKRAYQIVFFVVSMCVILSGYFIVKQRVDKKIVIYTDDFSWVYQVDEAYKDKGKFVLEGFAFELRADAKKDKFEIVLQETKTEEVVFLTTKGVEREDVNSYFTCGYNYTESGFIASIDEKLLSLENNEYEVLVRLKKSQKAYNTGIYIMNGEVTYTKEDNIGIPKVGDDSLDRIIEDGIMRVCLPKDGFYAYQYRGYLYYFIEEKYKQQKDYSSRIVTLMQTLQTDGLTSDTASTKVKEEEINVYISEESVCGDYYVCKVEMPTTYSITKIIVGNYNKYWVWTKAFRPVYEIEGLK